MMRRTYVNIGVFLVLSTVLIGWSVTNYVPLDALRDTRTVTAEFAESPGLREGYEVTYLGHSVGRIDAVRLAPGVSEVELAIDTDVDLPRDVVASARRRSAIGEPYVDLAPLPGSDADRGPRLADGDRIPASRTTSPIEYGTLFRALDELVRSVDAVALATVVHEAAAAVDGRGDDIRRILTGAHDLATTASANGDALEGLIADLGTVAGVLADHRASLGEGLQGLSELARALDGARPGLETLFAEGPSAVALLNGIVAASDDAIICTVDGLSVLEVVLDDDGQEAAARLITRSRAFADVVRLLRHPDDGIFRLLISVNSGTPEVVQYDQPAPVPTAAPLVPCPAHDVSVAATPADAAAPPGSGGRRPASDGAGDAVPDPSGTEVDLADTGTSDVRADEPALARALRRGLPWLLALALIAVLVRYLAGRRRQGDT